MTHSLQCFLIDDDIDDQKIFSIISEEVDNTIKCSFANDGVDAIEKLTTCEVVPDLIFLDVNMPRMDGVECLRKIKKIDRLKNIPVYMYSTTADPTTVTLTKRLGVKDFIVKPNNINELVNILTAIYNQHRMQAGSV
ncbi:MAG: response regulator receiver protein [Bacteroidetes bacterium]|jgi:CheY-like chemotaxis protein|nr:response regulator receiver protein [Bacteroidota bacterium]